MQIRGTLNENQGSLSAPLSSFIIQNKTGATVAYIDSGGNMYITGALTQEVLFD